MLEELATKTDSKLVLFVMDGVGGIPGLNGKTELEAARKPNLDELAKKSITGQSIAIAPGITPGSGPAHMSLFGYDPVQTEIGRGILEALGVGLQVTSRDVAVRGNFATMDSKRLVTDRRAGRIPTEENEKICSILRNDIRKIDDVEVIVVAGKEHRFVLMLRGDGLDDKVTETDPQKVGLAPLECKPEHAGAAKTAKAVNEFVRRAEKVLKPPANTMLLRGFAKHPKLASMTERFKLTPACIATYPMYKGLATLVGMEILKTGTELADEMQTLRENWGKYDFFFVHFKKTDSRGEDGDFDAKVHAIEDADSHIPEILALKPDVMVVTGDHSTPAMLKGHSWHPNPFMLYSNNAMVDDVTQFTERACSKGGLGTFQALNTIPLMLAHGLKLQKFGA